MSGLVRVASGRSKSEIVLLREFRKGYICGRGMEKNCLVTTVCPLCLIWNGIVDYLVMRNTCGSKAVLRRTASSIGYGK